jgi:hypothetical protein
MKLYRYTFTRLYTLSNKYEVANKGGVVPAESTASIGKRKKKLFSLGAHLGEFSGVHGRWLGRIF